MAGFRAQLAATGVTDLRRIMNANETGLLYKAMPTHTYVRSAEANTTRGSRSMQSKDRITIQIGGRSRWSERPSICYWKTKESSLFYREHKTC